MPFSFSNLGCPLRPVLLCVTGVSAAAVSSYFLFSRWRKIRDEQRATEDAVTQTDDHDGMKDQEQDFSSICVPIPEGVSLQAQLSRSCGPLANIWENCREVDRANRMFASTYTWWTSDFRKQVEVTLQHKAIYSGLESEHWWVLKNDFYTVVSLERPPQYFATARAVAYIKFTGTYISEAKIYLRAETSDSSVQDVLLSTTVSIIFKCVHIDTDGRFQYHDSNDAQTLETPAPVFSSGPRRPPPGF